jgi:hypothetical protein
LSCRTRITRVFREVLKAVSSSDRNKPVAENVCRFKGIVHSGTFKSGMTSFGSEYLMWRGSLRLPDTDSSSFMLIKLVAWDHQASFLQTVQVGTWVEVMACYSPDMFNGKLYDNFQVGAIRRLGCE